MENKNQTSNRIVNAHGLLNDNQFYSEKTNKKRIIIHHTAGGSAKSSINWWNQKPDRVGTPYLIDRDGTIYEVFNPEFWAYGLGINNSKFEKESIQIELCNWGWLQQMNGKFYTATPTPKELSKESVVSYKEKHRGFFNFEKYTPQQIESLIWLIDDLNKRFKIGVNNDVEKFWHYDINSSKKIISHTTVRKDKSDIHPQFELIKAIYDYVGCKAKITE